MKRLIFAACLFVVMAYSPMLAQVIPTGIWDMEWSPDGELLAMVDWNGPIHVIDNAGLLIHSLSGDSDEGSAVAWRPDSAVLASGGFDLRDISLWDIESGSLIQEIAPHANSIRDGVFNIEWSSNSAYVLATSFNTFQFWETTNWQTVEPIRSGSLLDAEWSPDGTLLAVSDIYYLSFFNGQTLVRDDLDEDVIEIVGENPEQLSWSTDSQLLATTDRLDPRISIWHVPTRTRIGVFNTTGARFMDVAFIGNDRVAAISETGMLYLFDTTGAVITTYDTGVSDARTMAWNQQSGIIAVAGAHTQINANGISGLPLLPLATILSASPAPTHTLTFTPTSTLTPTFTPTFTFTPSNTPTSTSTFTPTFTPTDTPTPTNTLTPTRTPTPTPTPIPLPPADTNLLTNPSFTSGLAPWNTVNFSAGGVVNGVLEVTQPTTVEYGVVWQSLSTMLPANTPMSFSLQLGNSSAVPKRVQVILRTSDWAQAATCEFVLPANSPLAAYSVRVRTAAVWGDILAQVWTFAPDDLPAVRIDSADLQYQPALTVNTTPDCLNQGGPILVNGQFEINTAGWSYVNYSSFSAVGGQLQVTHPASASYAAFWQELALPLPSGRAFEFVIDLSNTTGASRDAQLIVRGPDWNTARICAFSLPGDGISRRYTLRGTANGAWSSLFIQVWTFPGSTGGTFRADNAAFGTLGLGTTVPGGLACTG